MVQNTASFVIQVIFVIFVTTRVTCELSIKEQCLSQINKVFSNQESGFSSIMYAIRKLKDDMPLLTENEYALNYYNELKTYFREGHIMEPQKWFFDEFKSNTHVIDETTIQEEIDGLITKFGVQSVNILKHAYEKEIYFEDSKSLLNQYMLHILVHFGVDTSILKFSPKVYCQKKHVEQECLNELWSTFTNSKTGYECMQYAMKNLKIGSPSFTMRGYAMGYYNKLKNLLLEEDEYLKKFKSPEDFFKTDVIKMNERKSMIDRVGIAIGEITDTFGDSPKDYVIHVYRYELRDENDISPKQLYISHICDLVEVYDKKKVNQLNPEHYCKDFRDRTEEA